MAISPVMHGWITQQEFAKLLMLGSNGSIELTPPMTDDDRRDFEVHLRKRFGFSLAIQVKSAFVVRHHAGTRARYLHITISDFRSRIVTTPFFWYFLAHFSRRLMRFVDPSSSCPRLCFTRCRQPI